MKADESVPARVVALLAERGLDVSTVQAERLVGASDRRVAAAAQRQGRILVTLDRGFADARRYPPGSHPGVVVLRPVVHAARDAEALVRALLDGHDLRSLRGCLVVVEPGRVRIRRPEP